MNQILIINALYDIFKLGIKNYGYPQVILNSMNPFMDPALDLGMDQYPALRPRRIGIRT